jgi:hypothetical protein
MKFSFLMKAQEATSQNIGPTWTPAPINPARLLTLSFQRLANLDSAIFERLGRYEAALARQAAHCMFFLRSARYR